jgi:phosphoglycerol transferase MdoB-like AlkP superfamily enzyme
VSDCVCCLLPQFGLRVRGIDKGTQMAIRKLSFSREWQDWCNLLLGIWLCLSPWVLQFSGDLKATENAVAVGFLIIVAEVFTFFRLRGVEEWINIALGIWLVASVWALEITTSAAKVNLVLSGLLICLLALYEIWDARRGARRQA